MMCSWPHSLSTYRSWAGAKEGAWRSAAGDRHGDADSVAELFFPCPHTSLNPPAGRVGNEKTVCSHSGVQRMAGSYDAPSERFSHY